MKELNQRSPQAYLTVKEAAAELEVDAQIIYRLARTGKITADRIGRCYRIPREALWMASERKRNFTIQEVYARLERIESKLDALLAGDAHR